MEKLTILLMDYTRNVGWAVIAAVCMSISLGILLRYYDKDAPAESRDERKKSKIALAIIMGIGILACSIMVGLVISSPGSVSSIGR